MFSNHVSDKSLVPGYIKTLLLFNNKKANKPIRNRQWI